MGVGYPLDLVVCTALGVDMYDCVYPTRTARFGVALVGTGVLKLKNNACANETGKPIEEGCECMTCKNYSRAAIHRLLKSGALGCQLVTYHNLAYMLGLMRRMRKAIMEGGDVFPSFVLAFLKAHYLGESGKKGGKTVVVVPEWVREALAVAGIEVPQTFGGEREGEKEGNGSSVHATV